MSDQGDIFGNPETGDDHSPIPMPAHPVRSPGSRMDFLFVFWLVSAIALIVGVGGGILENLHVHVPEPLFGFLGVSGILGYGTAQLLERRRRRRP